MTVHPAIKTPKTPALTGDKPSAVFPEQDTPAHEAEVDSAVERHDTIPAPPWLGDDPETLPS